MEQNLPTSSGSLGIKIHDVNQLKTIILYLVQERRQTRGKLIGVQALSEQLEKKETENKGLRSKVEQLEILAARAENRLAQLSLESGIGPHMAKGIITPGVSKKVLETLTRDNTKLKLALEHVVQRGPESADLAEENLDLSNIVVTLKTKLEQSEIETEELRSALRAVESEDTMQLQEQVAKLTRQVTKAQQEQSARQVFCESLSFENKQLRAGIDSLKNERVTQVAELRELLGPLVETNPHIKHVMERVWPADNVDGHTEKVQNQVIELENEVKKYQEKQDGIEQDNTQLKERVVQLEQELKQSKEVNQDYENHFKIVLAEKENFERELASMRRQLEDHKMETELMQQQLRSFEDDFKVERQEKKKAQDDVKREQQKYNALHAQYQNFQLIVQHLPGQMSLKQQQQPVHHPEPQQQKPKTPSQPPQLPLGGCRPQMPWTAGPSTTNLLGYRGEVVADGPGKGKASRALPAHRNNGSSRDSPASRPQGPSSARPAQSMDRLECPMCRQFLPYDEIENHLTDCQEKHD